MNEIQLQTNPEVELVFDNHPNSVQDKRLALRKLVIQTAGEIDEITKLEETLK